MAKTAYSAKKKRGKEVIVIKKRRGKAKHIKKKTTRKAKSTEVIYRSTKEIKVEKALVENFIGLQKVMVLLSAKFDNLSRQISRLLNLFEVSAQALVKREASSGNQEAKQVMEKLENLSQHTGLIGKGMALIHEVETENEPVTPSVQLPSSAVSPSHPGLSSAGPALQKKERELEEFEKSQDIGEPKKPAAAKNWKFGEETNAGTNT